MIQNIHGQMLSEHPGRNAMKKLRRTLRSTDAIGQKRANPVLQGDSNFIVFGHQLLSDCNDIIILADLNINQRCDPTVDSY